VEADHISSALSLESLHALARKCGVSMGMHFLPPYLFCFSPLLLSHIPPTFSII
jgi:hypothetical protein